MAVTFLPGVLSSAQLRVRLAFGADPRSDPAGWTWTDVTADVLQDEGRTIDITVGKGAESPTAPPAQCTLALKNTTGNYTQHSGKSTYYPNLREGLPLWVELFVSGSWHTRFFGYCKGFTPAWDTTGNYAISKVDAYGVTRRLIQGKAPTKSALTRGIPIHLAPLSYFPLEEGAGATAALSAVSQQSLAADGVVNFGQADGIPGSAPVANLTAAGTLAGTMTSAAGTGEVRIEFAAKFPVVTPGTSASVTALRIYFDPSGTFSYIDLFASANDTGVGIGFRYGASDTGTGQSGTGFLVDGEWHWYSMDLVFSGGFVNIDISQDGVPGTLGAAPATASMGAVASVLINPAGSLLPAPFSIGHLLTLQNDLTSAYDLYLGNVGESPAVRLERLCGEQGEVYETVGVVPYVAKASMGPQGMDSFLDLLRECEVADAGYLYDGLSQGVQYQGVADRYNAAPLMSLDASAGQLQPDFQPVGDDLGRVNSMTVTRKGGSSVTYTDTDGPLGTNNVGVYDSSITVNVSSDGALEHRAGWEVSKGTIEGFRYPSLAINLRSIPTKAPDWLTVVPGSTITVTPPYSAQLPTDAIDLIVEGWTERLTNLRWEVSPINCSPALIFQNIGVFASAVGSDTSKYDADGSYTNATSNTTTGTIVVKSLPGHPLWTTNSAEMPFDVNIGGERCRVTAISSSTSPQTFTVTRSINGVVRSHVADEPVHLWAPARFGF